MTKPERDLDEILSAYVDILNSKGPDSAQERAYLEKYSQDAEASAVLRGARAVKALFDAFGQFPVPDASKEPRTARKPSPSSGRRRRAR